MEIEKIMETFCLFADMSADEGEAWRTICMAAHGTILENTGGAGAEENKLRLEMAAAAVAFYQYSLITSTQDVHNLKIGDIQVSSNAGDIMSLATKLRDECLAAISDCMIKKHGFVFKEVQNVRA